MAKHRKWKSCTNCAQFQPVKQEGVCKYLTEYNGTPVYVHRNYRCVKHFDKEVGNAANGKESKAG